MLKIDELKNELETAKIEAQNLINDKKVDEAKAKMAEIEELKASIEIQKQLDAEALQEVTNKIDNEKVDVKVENVKQTANALRAMIKAGMGRGLTEAENALLVPSTGAGDSGEGYLLPQDIKTIIQEKIRQYKSFRDVLGYIPTTALSGSFPVEDFETLTGLVDFTDGTDGTEPTDIKFTNVTFKLKSKGAILRLSNTLLQMTDNNLIQYIAGVFAKKAVITENTMAVSALKEAKTVKDIADWQALKKSINVDLDEAIKLGAVIVTNQDGFNALDEQVDSTGRPILNPDPANATQKLFNGLPVHVFSNALLPSGEDSAPIFYGNLAEAVKFVDNDSYSFATSEHAGFTSNVTVARVIEHVDVVQVDKSDKIYIVGELAIA